MGCLFIQKNNTALRRWDVRPTCGPRAAGRCPRSTTLMKADCDDPIRHETPWPAASSHHDFIRSPDSGGRLQGCLAAGRRCHAPAIIEIVHGFCTGVDLVRGGDLVYRQACGSAIIGPRRGDGWGRVTDQAMQATQTAHGISARSRQTAPLPRRQECVCMRGRMRQAESGPAAPAVYWMHTFRADRST